MSTTEDSGAGPDRVEGGPGATDGQMRQKGDGADGESGEAEDAGLEHLTRDDLVERYRIMEEHLHSAGEAGLQLVAENESLRAQLADHEEEGAAHALLLNSTIPRIGTPRVGPARHSVQQGVH